MNGKAFLQGQGRQCDFFKWHDGSLGLRATEVIKELLDTVERLEDSLVAAKASHDYVKKKAANMRIALVVVVLVWVFKCLFGN